MLNFIPTFMILFTLILIGSAPFYEMTLVLIGKIAAISVLIATGITLPFYFKGRRQEKILRQKIKEAREFIRENSKQVTGRKELKKQLDQTERIMDDSGFFDFYMMYTIMNNLMDGVNHIHYTASSEVDPNQCSSYRVEVPGYETPDQSDLKSEISSDEATQTAITSEIVDTQVDPNSAISPDPSPVFDSSPVFEATSISFDPGPSMSIDTGCGF